MSSTRPTGAFSLLTTLRYPVKTDAGGKAQDTIWLLPYHLERLHVAARMHGWHDAAYATVDGLLTACTSALATSQGDDSDTDAFRISVRLAEDGSLKAIALPLPRTPSWSPTHATSFNPEAGEAPLIQPVLTIYIDSQATEPSLFTKTKTTQREHYDAARFRVASQLGRPLSPQEDVLMFNSSGEIMETSICNVAFWRSHRWVTPAALTGCLPGIARRYFLEQGLITEPETGDTLKPTNVRHGECILLFNAVRGAQLGRLEVGER